jgi:hypothetical protein
MYSVARAKKVEIQVAKMAQRAKVLEKETTVEKSRCAHVVCAGAWPALTTWYVCMIMLDPLFRLVVSLHPPPLAWNDHDPVFQMTMCVEYHVLSKADFGKGFLEFFL